jgi:hypothetical protein
MPFGRYRGLELTELPDVRARSICASRRAARSRTRTSPSFGYVSAVLVPLTPDVRPMAEALGRRDNPRRVGRLSYAEVEMPSSGGPRGCRSRRPGGVGLTYVCPSPPGPLPGRPAGP